MIKQRNVINHLIIFIFTIIFSYNTNAKTPQQLQEENLQQEQKEKELHDKKLKEIERIKKNDRLKKIQAAKNGYVFFKIYKNNEKSRFSSNIFQNIFKESGFKITSELNRAAYILDVNFDVSSSNTPIYEGGQSKPHFVNVTLDINKIATKEIVYSANSSGIYPHISASQGHQIAAKKAIDKIKAPLIQFLSKLKK